MLPSPVYPLSPGGDDGTVIEIDGHTGKKEGEFIAHSGSVNAVKTRNENTFISAGYDGICRVIICLYH